MAPGLEVPCTGRESWAVLSLPSWGAGQATWAFATSRRVIRGSGPGPGGAPTSPILRWRCCGCSIASAARSWRARLPSLTQLQELSAGSARPRAPISDGAEALCMRTRGQPGTQDTQGTASRVLCPTCSQREERLALGPERHNSPRLTQRGGCGSQAGREGAGRGPRDGKMKSTQGARLRCSVTSMQRYPQGAKAACFRVSRAPQDRFLAIS